jgi:hypothetical protein
VIQVLKDPQDLLGHKVFRVPRVFREWLDLLVARVYKDQQDHLDYSQQLAQ